MGKREKLSLDRVRSILDYDRATGVFRWRNPPSNRVKRGALAGSISGKYRTIGIDGLHYQASALALFYVSGIWPAGVVDHKNRDTIDNSFENLRDATFQENAFNSGAHRDNRVGFKGVHRHSDGRYRAQLSIGGQRKHIGVFETPELAHQAYIAAAQVLHGKFFHGGDNR